MADNESNLVAYVCDPGTDAPGEPFVDWFPADYDFRGHRWAYWPATAEEVEAAGATQ
jgi:hypothetical protein